jgi:Fic family protein
VSHKSLLRERRWPLVCQEPTGEARNQLPALLTELENRARIASITASSALEGVVVDDQARAAAIIGGKVTTLRTRSEQELAGYRAALDYLFGQDWRQLNVGLLLHLHRNLFEQTKVDGGRFKDSDNLVVDRSPDGLVEVRFVPVSAASTEYFTVELIDRYKEAITEGRHHPVLLVGLFVLDLLTIHPFADGNGRVVRAYQRFEQRAASDRSTGTKQDRVREYVLEQAPQIFRIADVRVALPGVSDPTIRLTLEQLKNEAR